MRLLKTLEYRYSQSFLIGNVSMICETKQDVSIILASASPRRVELLKQIGVDCTVSPADIDESVLKDELARDYVIRLAKQKASACLSQLEGTALSNQPVLAADTTVVYGGKIFGKPANDVEAIKMLNTLSGSVHHVHTAVALIYEDDVQVVLSSTAVEFMSISSTQIDYYIASGEHQGKAGSYGIQGLAATWIKRIDGSYSGVMGLPLYETAMLLRKVNYLKG